jgi:hypothetical protein
LECDLGFNRFLYLQESLSIVVFENFSAEDAKTEQDEIRPKFLQMQGLLLAFLTMKT